MNVYGLKSIIIKFESLKVLTSNREQTALCNKNIDTRKKYKLSEESLIKKFISRLNRFKKCTIKNNFKK